jgi:hypothetical protein
VPTTSLEVGYAVVAALNVAADVYRAILNVSAAVEARTTPVPKLWIPSRISTLNDVAIACVIAMKGS